MKRPTVTWGWSPSGEDAVELLRTTPEDLSRAGQMSGAVVPISPFHRKAIVGYIDKLETALAELWRCPNCDNDSFHCYEEGVGTCHGCGREFKA